MARILEPPAGLKVYVAGKFEDAKRVRILQNKLTAEIVRLEISHDWTREEELPVGSPDQDVQNHHQLCAQADYQGVLDCDVLVFLVQANCKGAYVELGMALALGKKVIVVLDRTQVAAGNATPSHIDPAIGPTGGPLPMCIFFKMPGVIVTDSDDKVVGLVNRLVPGTFQYNDQTGVKTNPR